MRTLCASSSLEDHSFELSGFLLLYDAVVIVAVSGRDHLVIKEVEVLVQVLCRHVQADASSIERVQVSYPLLLYWP
jgi:hypothetical protein